MFTRLLDLAAHKAPNLKVLELNISPGNSESLWLTGNLVSRSVRAASAEYHFASDSANTVIAAQQLYSESPAAQNARFSVMDLSSDNFSLPPGISHYDLVVIRRSRLNPNSALRRLASNVRRLLAEGGSVILYDPDRSNTLKLEEREDGWDIVHDLECTNFKQIRQTAGGNSVVAGVCSEKGTGIDAAPALGSRGAVVLVHFSSRGFSCHP